MPIRLRIAAFIIHRLFQFTCSTADLLTSAGGGKLSEEIVLQDYRELQGQLIEHS